MTGDASTTTTFAAPTTPLSRRRLLHAGITGAAATAVLAACGGSSGSGDQAAVATTTTEPRATGEDQVTLRTATSLELLLVQVYEQVLASGVLSESGTATAELFLEHHERHAALFHNESLKAGGEPVTAPNAVVSQSISARLALGSEADAMNLAYDLEQIARSTYVGAAGDLQTVELNEVLLSVAGIDGRHLAVLGAITGRPQVDPSGFAGTEGGLTPGTGLS